MIVVFVDNRYSLDFDADNQRIYIARQQYITPSAQNPFGRGCPAWVAQQLLQMLDGGNGSEIPGFGLESEGVVGSQGYVFLNFHDGFLQKQR